MQVADNIEDKVAESLNAQGRSPGHIFTGVAICLGLIALTTSLSVVRPQPVAPGAEPTRDPWKRAIWPSLFSVTTLAALRVWNAPDSRERTRALTWWGLLQGANAAFTLWRPQGRGGQVTAAVTTAAVTAAYARAAAHVDQKAASMAAPTGFAGLASLVATPD